MLRAIERLLRLTKAWIVWRTQRPSCLRSVSGGAIFRTSAPMSAMIIPGISAGGTRASSSTLIPSSTPMGLSCLFAGHGRARGQRADVGHILQMRELVGHALGLARAQHRRGAAEELRAQLRVGQRLV